MSDITPYFREDIARVLMGVYFSSAQSNNQPEHRKAFAAALSSVALAFGVRPDSFLSPEDIQLLKKG